MVRANKRSRKQKLHSASNLTHLKHRNLRRSASLRSHGSNVVPHSLFQETLVTSNKYMQRGDMFRLQKRNLQKRIDCLAASKREIEAEKRIYTLSFLL